MTPKDALEAIEELFRQNGAKLSADIKVVMGGHLKSFRTGMDMSLADLGFACGVTHTTVGRWESGTYSIPTTVIPKLRAALSGESLKSTAIPGVRSLDYLMNLMENAELIVLAKSHFRFLAGKLPKFSHDLLRLMAQEPRTSGDRAPRLVYVYPAYPSDVESANPDLARPRRSYEAFLKTVKDHADGQKVKDRIYGFGFNPYQVTDEAVRGAATKIERSVSNLSSWCYIQYNSSFRGALQRDFDLFVEVHARSYAEMRPTVRERMEESVSSDEDLVVFIEQPHEFALDWWDEMKVQLATAFPEGWTEE